MKIYIISDIHLVAPGATSKGMDSAQRLQWAFDDLATNHADAALCVLLGDLADHAEADAYRSLRSMIASVRTPVITLLGNHDDRATYLAETPEAETDADGFVQAVRDTPMGRLIFLDTAETGYVTGHLCAKRQAWLSARLDEAAGRPVYLFMHHPPFDIGAKVDQLKFKDGEALAAMIARHGQVRHIAAGHTHRICGGTWRGTAFSNLGSTTYNTGVHLTGMAGAGARYSDSVNVGIMLVSEEQVVLHAHDVNPYRAPLPMVLFPQKRLEEIYARGGKLAAD
ncbi:phosphodiesterase [Falsiroseomonas sp.]|uniref:phosphodiesterase n=1 Tax=Falsiroseomonas sp. TaxID=2870721 RepID=UPI0034A158F5